MKEPVLLVSVTKGQIKAETVTCLHRTENCIVLSVECSSKYPEVLGTGLQDDSVPGGQVACLTLGKTERTIDVRDTAGFTRVCVVLPRRTDTRGTWLQLTDTGRYSVVWALVWYPHEDNVEVYWRADEKP